MSVHIRRAARVVHTTKYHCVRDRSGGEKKGEMLTMKLISI